MRQIPNACRNYNRVYKNQYQTDFGMRNQRLNKNTIAKEGWSDN